jgi:hypothetical protein
LQLFLGYLELFFSARNVIAQFVDLANHGGTVLDSGIRKCELPQFHSCLAQQLDRVLLTYPPSMAIISSSAGVNPKKRTLRRKLKAAAVSRGIELAEARPAVIRRYFSRFNAGTRYEIAQVVAEMFPELAFGALKGVSKEDLRIACISGAVFECAQFGSVPGCSALRLGNIRISANKTKHVAFVH